MNRSLLAAAARAYGADVSELHPLRGGNSESMVYEFSREGRPIVLRITADGSDVGAARAALEWVHYLDTRGAPVSGPVESLNGNLLEVVNEADHVATVTAYRKAAGTVAEKLPQSRWSPELFRKLGEATGKLHALSLGYQPAAHRRPRWNEFLAEYVVEGYLPEPDPAVLAKGLAMTAYLDTLPAPPEAFGLIHNDLHLANFAVHDAGVTVFDFDDCAYGWYVMDMATLFFDLLVLARGTRQEKAELAASSMAAFLSGYRLQKDISVFWLQQLPHFLKLLELNYYVVMMEYYPDGDWGWWGDLFMPGRRDSIVSDVPFVDVDFARLTGWHGSSPGPVVL